MGSIWHPFWHRGITEVPHSFEVLTVKTANSPWPRLSGSYLGSAQQGVNGIGRSNEPRILSRCKRSWPDAIVVVGGDSI